MAENRSYCVMVVVVGDKMMVQWSREVVRSDSNMEVSWVRRGTQMGCYTESG
jgi:hypothetical protein